MEDMTWTCRDMTETYIESQEYMISMLRTKNVFPYLNEGKVEKRLQ